MDVVVSDAAVGFSFYSSWLVTHNKYRLTLTVFVDPYLSSTLWADSKSHGILGILNEDDRHTCSQSTNPLLKLIRF
jgi:hypothetical protein